LLSSAWHCVSPWTDERLGRFFGLVNLHALGLGFEGQVHRWAFPLRFPVHDAWSSAIVGVFPTPMHAHVRGFPFVSGPIPALPWIPAIRSLLCSQTDPPHGPFSIHHGKDPTTSTFPSPPPGCLLNAPSRHNRHHNDRWILWGCAWVYMGVEGWVCMALHG